MKQSKLFKLKFFSLLVLPAILISSCGGSQSQNESEGNSSVTTQSTLDMPLNISIYVDLSDRLTHDDDMTPSQSDRDLAIVDYIADKFINDCVTNGKIINSKNHFQVFFYPTPNNSEIALLAKGLNIDMNKIDIKEKRQTLLDMKKTVHENLGQIYNDALSQQKWIGCDIWGFFSNKIVDDLCVRDGYRNILIILTDGYLYHANNKVKDGDAYSYVPQTIKNEKFSLIVKRTGLDDLEVLMLEVNPSDPKQHDKLISVLETWFNSMGIKRFAVSETALPTNTETIIDNFFDKQ